MNNLSFEDRLLFFEEPRPLPPPDSLVPEHILAKTTHLLAQRKFGEIVESQQLFWAAFCKASLKVNDPANERHFSIDSDGACVPDKNSPGHTQGLLEMIHYFQQEFRNSLEKRLPVSLLVVKDHRDVLVYCRSFAQEIEEPAAVQLLASSYRQHIRPILPEFAASLGMTFCSSDRAITVRSFFGNEPNKAEQIDFQWPESVRTYPIAPVNMLEFPSLERELHALYKTKGIRAPLLLRGPASGLDEETLSVPFDIVWARGGEVIRKIIDDASPFKSQSEISFGHTSLQTLRDWIDFLYLGPKKFSEAMEKENPTLNRLFYLFKFGHAYLVPGLVDCATNLISLFATPKDLSELQLFTSFYGNAHLNQLVAHFTSQPQTPALPPPPSSKTKIHKCIIS